MGDILNKGLGASAEADRAVVNGAASVSAVPASVPSADDLEVALWVAMTAHRGQRDKGGAPYVWHPIRVSQRFEDTELKIVALLHDVLEDSAYTASFIRSEFGDRVTDAVVALTKTDGQKYTAFIQQCGKNDLARRVKLADLADNMDIARLGREPTAEDARRQQKYANACGLLAEIGRAQGTSGSAQDPQGLDPKDAGPVPQECAPILPNSPTQPGDKYNAH